MNLADKLRYAKQHVDSIMRHDDATLQERAVIRDALVEYLGAEFVSAKKRSDTKAKADAAAAKKVKGAKASSKDDVGMSEPKRKAKDLKTPKRAAKH